MNVYASNQKVKEPYCSPEIDRNDPLTGKITEIYNGKLVEVPLVTVDPSDHYMGDRLKKYITSKSPPVELFMTKEQKPIRTLVIGVHRDHYDLYAKSKGWRFVQEQPIWDGTKSKSKITNFSLRPALYKMGDEDGEFLVLCALPSREDIYHWGSMLSQMLRIHNIRVQVKGFWHQRSDEKFVNYALDEKKIFNNLNSKAILVLGYVGRFFIDLKKNGFEQSHFLENGLLSLKVLNKSKKRFALLTVKFSFRGSIGYQLTKQLCQRIKPIGVLNISRVGQSVSPTAMKKTYFPSVYYLRPIETNHMIKVEGHIPYLPPIDGPHLSTPSILDAGYPTVIRSGEKGVVTFSTEGAYLALGCAEAKTPFTGAYVPYSFLRFRFPDNTKKIQASLVCKINQQILGKINQHIIEPPHKLHKIKTDDSTITPTNDIYFGELENIPIESINSSKHSMGDLLDKYAAQKNPPLHLFKCGPKGGILPVKVMGVLSKHFSSYAKSKGWDFIENGNPIWYGSKRERDLRFENYMGDKKGNLNPLVLYKMRGKDGDFLALLTTPSPESVRHRGSMINHLLKVNDQKIEVSTVYHKNSAEAFVRSILESSQLKDALKEYKEWQGGEAVLILGYTRAVAKHLVLQGYRENPDGNLMEEAYSFKNRGPFSYTLMKKKGHAPALILEVNFSLWGSIAKHFIMELCQEVKPKGIVHIAKSGQSNDKSSLNHIFVPGNFWLNDYKTNELRKIQRHLPFFKFRDIGQYLDGDHLSVSTIFDETHSMVTSAKKKGIVTYDIEGSWFAEASSILGVPFGAVYYQSDFVSSCEEETKQQKFCTRTLIVNNYSTETRNKEELLKSAICQILIRALFQTWKE